MAVPWSQKAREALDEPSDGIQIELMLSPEVVRNLSLGVYYYLSLILWSMDVFSH